MNEITFTFPFRSLQPIRGAGSVLLEVDAMRIAIRRWAVSLFIGLGMFATLDCRCDAADDSRVPNFVVILVDDLGYGDLGCYGNTVNKTPEIDRLAARGLRCRDFHSNGPMCSPTRAAFLTGCYQQRFGKDFDHALGPDPAREPGLPLDAVTLAEVLARTGYATGLFGKWHLGFKPPLTPKNQGFHEFRGLLSGDGDYHTRIDRLGEKDWWVDDEIKMESGYTTDLITNHSIDFIERHRDKPFFLYMAHLAIHFPWQGPNDPPQRAEGTNYNKEKWGIIPDHKNVAPHVKAMVESLDQSVGRVMATLEKLNLADQTLVVFTSDNGGYLNYADGGFERISSNGPFKGQKGDVHEGGHRVPGIFVWPSRIAAGQVTDETVMTMDLFPTFARLAKARLPDEQRLDGVDLGPLLFEQKKLLQRNLCWRKGDMGAIRRGDWKVNLSDRTKPQLFHLGQDPGESTNKASEQAGLVKYLMSAYDKWESDVNGGFRSN